MLIKLTMGFATYFDGKKRRTITYKSGPADVPDETAKKWISRGRAVAVDAKERVVESEPETVVAVEAESVEYGSMDVKSLRDEAKARGINTTGVKKAKLIQMLEADDAQLDDDGLEPLAPED